MKLFLLALLILASNGSSADTLAALPKDCSSPRFAPGYFLLSSKLDSQAVVKIADQISASGDFQVIEILDHIVASDGSSHPFSGLVIQASQPSSQGEVAFQRNALSKLSQLPDLDLACVSSESVQNGQYIGI